jgi:hypothetical protein
MQMSYRSYRALAVDLISILFVSGTIGIALKFITFLIILNQNLASGNLLTDLFFPYFPNVLDSAFLISSVLYLTWRLMIARRRSRGSISDLTFSQDSF